MEMGGCVLDSKMIGHSNSPNSKCNNTKKFSTLLLAATAMVAVMAVPADARSADAIDLRDVGINRANTFCMSSTIDNSLCHPNAPLHAPATHLRATAMNVAAPSSAQHYLPCAACNANEMMMMMMMMMI
jgi:hypothetical protein